MLWTLIAVSSTFRLAWAASLGPGIDEAYHYLFAVHRDWSYFDHPPMLAVVESAGLAVMGGVASPFALRIGFVALFAGSTWLMFRLTSRFFGDRAGFLAAFALNASAYHTAAASSFALPDGPLLFFWLLTLDQLASALDQPTRLRPWVGVGLAWGCAMLSKYHAVFLVAGAGIYLIAEPSARKFLLKPGPYLAALIGLVVFSPVIYWNATHEWASFAFQGARAVTKVGFRPDALAGAIGGQAAYLFPWIWLALLGVLVRVGRDFVRSATPPERFLICQAVTPLVAFTAVACLRPVLPHWTLVGYVSLFPLLGRAWNLRWDPESGRLRGKVATLAAIPLAVMGLMVVEYRTGFLQRLGLPVHADPTVDQYGWDQVAAELDRRGLLAEPGEFLFTRSWFTSGQLAFAMRKSAVPVLCYNHKDSRSFGFWSEPGEWVGRDGILVSVDPPAFEPACYERFFERIEPLGSFEVDRWGGPVRKVYFYRCSGQKLAFPFRPGRLDAATSEVAADPRSRR
jgi:4-amino-4-deoxy-L-arabinose transferase-like glycosyltransferase